MVMNIPFAFMAVPCHNPGTEIKKKKKKKNNKKKKKRIFAQFTLTYRCLAFTHRGLNHIVWGKTNDEYVLYYSFFVTQAPVIHFFMVINVHNITIKCV